MAHPIQTLMASDPAQNTDPSEVIFIDELARFQVSKKELDVSKEFEETLAKGEFLTEEALTKSAEEIARVFLESQFSTYDQDAYIDEAVLGLPHKPISDEDRKDLSKKTISVIEEYYNSLENTIVDLKDSELETVRLNLIESIHTSSLTKKYQKESDKPIHEKNLYHLNRIRCRVILEQEKRGIIWEK